MYLLVKELNGERVIIGTSHRMLSEAYIKNEELEVFQISDDEFSEDMIYSKIEDFEVAG